MTAEELAEWLIENGCAEGKRGYGHICGEDLAERLLAHFTITGRTEEPRP